MSDKYLTGMTSLPGVQYVGIDTDTGVRWFPHSLFTSADRVVVAALSTHGIHLVGKKSLAAFKAKLDRLTDFPVGLVAEKPGWNPGDMYVLDGDTVFTPGTTTQIPISLDPLPAPAAQAGALADWKDTVAKPVAKQPLAGFLMMAAFLPVIIRLMPHVPNAVFEVVGRGGIGKSTLLQLAASVSGGPGVHGEARFWHSFGAGPDALSRLIEQHSDQLLILDELNALLASPDKKAVVKAYLRLGHGLGRAPSSHHPGGAYRGLTFIAGNDRLRVRAQKQPIEGDQIITLAPGGWLHEVFPKLPTGYDNGAAYAEALAAAAACAHGTAIRAFLPKLLDDLAARARLERRLERWQDRFLTKTGGRPEQRPGGADSARLCRRVRHRDAR